MKPLAMYSGDSVRVAPWPNWPRLDQATIKKVIAVMDSGNLSLTGHGGSSIPNVLSLEREFATYYGAAYAIATSSGAAALVVLLKALGVGAGSQVLVPANTWVVVPQCVRFVGAEPVLVDIDTQTQTMAGGKAKEAPTSSTKTIILVHQNGAVADASEFRAIADAHAIALIEDCSHAHGAKWNGRRVGSVGHAAMFSAQQTKLLTSGEGGLITTNDKVLAETAARIRGSGRLHQFDDSKQSLLIDENSNVMGFNFMSPEVAAVLLRDQLLGLDEMNATRQRNAAWLAKCCDALDGIRACNDTAPNSELAYHKYVVAFNDVLLEKRPLDWFARALSAELGFGVSRLHHPLFANGLLPATEVAHGCESVPGAVSGNDAFPAVADAFGRCLSFRHQYLLGGDSDMIDIANAFEKVLSYVAKQH